MPGALRVQRYAFSVTRSALCVTRSALRVQRYAFSVARSALRVQRYAFSVTRYAFSVMRTTVVHPYNMFSGFLWYQYGWDNRSDFSHLLFCEFLKILSLHY